jgi:hypothetical protein
MIAIAIAIIVRTPGFLRWRMSSSLHRGLAIRLQSWATRQARCNDACVQPGRAQPAIGSSALLRGSRPGPAQKGGRARA